IAVATESYGLVAANCLTFSSGTTVDMAPKYQVAISGDQKAVFGTFDISKVTVHPKYDTATLANNLAIVYFDASSKGKFTNLIADWPAEWKSYYFVRQTPTNSTTPGWNSPLVAVTDATADSGNCAKLSSLYSKYQKDLICTQVTAPTYAVKGCVAPFGSMYGVGSINVALGALFSHSATSGGEGLCSKGQVYSYYIILRNYLAWVSKEVGNPVSVLHGPDNTYTAQTNADYAMGTTQASNTITDSTTSSTTTTSTTTSTSSTNSASNNSAAATVALVASLITATLTQAPTTVTITAPVSTLVTTVTTTSVSTSVLTVTPVPSVVFVTLPPVIQTVVSTVTSTVTNVVTSVIAFTDVQPTSSVTPTLPPQPSINPTSSESKLSGAAIAALVIGLLLLTALLAFLYIRRKRRQRQDGHAYAEEYDSGLSRVRKWLFERGNGPPRGSSPPLIAHDSQHY
ncbi:hypothetical protein GGH92_005108, partial [Coemansia sp. RSA 2673]